MLQGYNFGRRKHAKTRYFCSWRRIPGRDGLGKQVAEWEDGLRAPTDPGSFEWWYFDAHLADGSTAVIVYATKAIINPNVPLMPNLSLTITRPDGTKTAQFALPPAGEFSASKERCEVRIGASWVRQSMLEGRWVYELHAETKDMSADLTFSGLVRRGGRGRASVSLGIWIIILPGCRPSRTGRSRGRCADGQTHAVEGTGYHDHNWGNVALPAVMDHWYWGRAHVEGYTLIFVEQIAAKKYGSVRMPVFLLAKGDQVLADDARCLSMEGRDFVRHAGGREYPSQVDFTWQRGEERCCYGWGEASRN